MLRNISPTASFTIATPISAFGVFGLKQVFCLSAGILAQGDRTHLLLCL
jgi:hypothetical protein